MNICFDSSAGRGGQPKVFILLATYNGAEFLSEQIQSIQAQTISNWTLLARDDGSDDATKDVLEKFAAQDERIKVVDDKHDCLGAIRNFGELLRLASNEEPDYVFFSDQDDVWASNKMADQLTGLTEMESRYGKMTPILAYSDLEVVSDQLERIHPSFMAYQGLVHEAKDPLRVLLSQNFVTGCATAINRSLMELALPIPAGVIMHDWWLALCAASCGQIEYLPIPLTKYRQHAANQLGAQKYWGMINPLSSGTQKRLGTGSRLLAGTVAQASELYERIKVRDVHCSEGTAKLLHEFSSLLRRGALARLWTAYRIGLQRQGLLRQLLLAYRLLRGVPSRLPVP